MMRRALMAAVLGMLAATRAEAEVIVVPPGNATTEGNTTFGLGGNLTFQQVYGSPLLAGLPIGSVIDGFSFRLDSAQGSNPAITFDAFDISIGRSNFAPGALTPSVAANEGADTVLARSGSLSFAAGSFPSGSSPNAFGPLISFTTPYTYTGGDLLLTASIGGSGQEPYTVDAQDPASGTEYRENFGDTNQGTVSADFNQYGLIVQFDVAPPAATPEPATLGSLALAAIGSGLYGWRKARRRKVG